MNVLAWTERMVEERGVPRKRWGRNMLRTKRSMDKAGVGSAKCLSGVSLVSFTVCPASSASSQVKSSVPRLQEVLARRGFEA